MDGGDSTQGSISELLSDLCNVKVGYYGTLLSSALDSSTAAEEANDKHMKPWAEACRHDQIENTPLSPHTDSELLLHKHLWLNGSKLKNLGFDLNIPKPTTEHLRQILEDYVRMKVFPSSLAF